MATESKPSTAGDTKPPSVPSLKQRHKTLKKVRAAKQSNQPSAADREFANLQQIEARLKNKIANRIPNFKEPTPGSNEQALERAQRHLEEIQAAIKNHPQNK